MGSRKRGTFFGVLALALLSISGAALYGSTEQSLLPRSADAVIPPARASVPSVVIEPQDGIEPVEQAIHSASSSIDVVMYEFEDRQLERLLAQKAREGVAVRVILDNGYFGAGSSANQEAFDSLRASGAQVQWSPPYFALTHEKMLAVDRREALVMTFNFTPHYYRNDRDFGIVDTDPSDVAAIEQAFDTDWGGQHAAAQNGDDLVWSPNSRGRIVALIRSAASTLRVYNEEMQDQEVIAALESAARSGVDVKIVMTYSNKWERAFAELSNAGARVRTYGASAPLYIHAKAVIADGKEAFVGSENFSSTSLDQNRELGVIISDPQDIRSISGVFDVDWQRAAPL